MNNFTQILLGITLMFFISTQANILNAQVTIGSGRVPNEGALLDLKEDSITTKGLGLPRVELKALSELTMGTNVIANTGTAWADHTGLMVYNVKGDNCAIPEPIYTGPYVWDGGMWQFLGEKYRLSPGVYRYTDPRDEEKYLYREFYYMDGDSKVSAGEWMLENLRYIPNVADGYNNYIHGIAGPSSEDKCFAYAEGDENPYNPDNHPSIDWGKYKKNGLLYSWSAAINMGSGIGETPDPGNLNQGQGEAGEATQGIVQGICPMGWHVPSDREWNELERAIYNNASEFSQYKNDTSDAFTPATWDAAWETTKEWRGSSVNGHNLVMRSECPPIASSYSSGGKSFSSEQGGFNTLLVGFGAGNATRGYGKYSYFWSSSSISDKTSWIRLVNRVDTQVYRSYYLRTAQFPIRCKRD